MGICKKIIITTFLFVAAIIVTSCNNGSCDESNLYFLETNNIDSVSLYMKMLKLSPEKEHSQYAVFIIEIHNNSSVSIKLNEEYPEYFVSINGTKWDLIYDEKDIVLSPKSRTFFRLLPNSKYKPTKIDLLNKKLKDNASDFLLFNKSLNDTIRKIEKSKDFIVCPPTHVGLQPTR